MTLHARGHLVTSGNLLIVSAREGVFLAFGEQRPGLMLRILHCSGQLPITCLAKMSVKLRLKNLV